MKDCNKLIPETSPVEVFKKVLGKVVPTRDGVHSRTRCYEDLSLVYDADTKMAYISRKCVPCGIPVTNTEYWQPMNISGYSDANTIIISDKDDEGNLIPYTLASAIASIPEVGRKPGAIISFYSEEGGPHWEIWQFNSTDVDDWEDVSKWNAIYNTSIILADEEDITKDSESRLKFKNRTTQHGKGYIILRREKTFAEQLTQSNTIYQVKYDFDLDGAVVTMPSNCVLAFEGGRITNGKVESNNTIITGYNETSDALYGVFYNESGTPLCMGNKTYIGLQNAIENAVTTSGSAKECAVTFIPESLVATTENFYFIGCVGSTPDIGYVSAYDRNWNFLGQAQIPEFGHANGATICGNKIYVAPNEDDYPISYANISDVLNACTNNGTLHATVINNVPSLVRSFSIDYDEINDEFVILNRNSNGHCNMQVYDRNFNLLKKFDTDLTTYVYNHYLDKENTDSTNPGTFGDIVARKGVVYAAFWRKEGSSNSSRQTAIYIEIDATTGTPVAVLGSLENLDMDRIEPEGFCKDPEDPEVFWINFINKKRSNQWSTYIANYFAKLSFTKEITSAAMMGKSMGNNMIYSRQNEYIVYVNNKFTGYSNGNYTNPYKSLITAFLMTPASGRTTIRMFESDTPYNVGHIELFNTDLRLDAYGRGAVLEGIFYFSNCFVTLQSLTYQLKPSDEEGFNTGIEAVFSSIDIRYCTFDAVTKDPNMHDRFFHIDYDSKITLRGGVIFKNVSIGIDLEHNAEFGQCGALTCENVARVFRIIDSSVRVAGRVLKAITLDENCERKFTCPSDTVIPSIIQYYVPSSIDNIEDLHTHLDDVFTGVASKQNVEVIIKNLSLPSGSFYYDDSGILTPVNRYTPQNTERPTYVSIGYAYFDLNLGKPIWAKSRDSQGNMTWVDSEGRDVSQIVAILGDGLTSFSGTSPSGYSNWYPRYDIKNKKDMWWYQVSNTFDNTPVNCSWANSTMTGAPKGTAICGCSDARVADAGRLGDPKIIFITLGHNDWYNAVTLGTWSSGDPIIDDSEYSEIDTIDNFSDAYALLLSKLQTAYPNSTIYCTTILDESKYDTTTGAPSTNSNGETIPQWNTRIKAIAQAFNVNVMDIHESAVQYDALSTYTADGLNLNLAGQKAVADYVIETLRNS